MPLLRYLERTLRIAGTALVLGTALAACGGGGGGSSAPAAPGTATPVPTASPTPSPSPTASPTPSPTATPTPGPPINVISGILVDRAAGTPISGATVTVGTLPSQGGCVAAQTNANNACGSVGSTLGSTTTSRDGTFTVTGLSTGTDMLVISNGSTFATLHATVAVASGTNALGTLKITALSADQQGWVSDINTQRTTVATPLSYGNLIADEYAIEEEQAMVNAVAAGSATYGPSAETTYDGLYGQQPGAIYIASNVSGLSTSSGAYVTVDQNWMAEQTQCPNVNWQTCTFSAATGAYINLSNTVDVWVGPAESSGTIVPPGGGPNSYVYGVMIVQNASGSGLVAGIHRAPLHRR